MGVKSISKREIKSVEDLGSTSPPFFAEFNRTVESDEAVRIVLRPGVHQVLASG
jgi:hypothetical protein